MNDRSGVRIWLGGLGRAADIPVPNSDGIVDDGTMR